MKLETFFEKFELFADAPDAVARMRDLVLALAVQGKLVDPVLDDEPVDEFLRRIWTSKNGGRIELLDSEKSQPFELPPHWRWVALAEVAEFSIGKTPPRGDSSYWYPEDHCWVSIADMQHYGTITETKEKVSESAAQDVFRQRFAEPGSILMSFKLTIGKVARAGIRCFHNEAIISLLPPEPELSDYLFRFLPIFAKLQTSNNAIKGNTLNKGLLTLLPIALPPLAEQKRIVAKVDELMALCDRLEAQQQERDTRHAALVRASLARFTEAPTPANLQFLFHPSYDVTPADLRKTILTLAVQGKLVPQDPNDEPALVLLEKIAAHKADLAKTGKLRGANTVKPFANGEAGYEIPTNWCWVRFGDIMINRDGERIPVSKEERETKAKVYDYYGASGVIDKIDDYLFDKPLLLIGEDGANLINRSTPIAFIARGKYWVNNHAHVLDGISEDFLRFIELHINAINLEKYVTGSAQPKMNQAKMNSIPIALPPLAEQRRIVAKVEQLMALVDELEKQLANSRATAEKLLAALLAELTNGKEAHATAEV